MVANLQHPVWTFDLFATTLQKVWISYCELTIRNLLKNR